MELLWYLVPIPVFGHPAQRGGAVGCVDFKDVEPGREAENHSGHCLPEAGPLHDASVVVNDFSLLEGQGGVGFHAGGLYEWLELVAGVGRRALDAEDALDGFFSKDGVAEPVCDVGELLVIAPLNLVLRSLVVIVVTCGRSVFEGFLEVDFLGLRHPGACGLSPPVVVLKEAVVQVRVPILSVVLLVEASRDVALLVKVLWPDLCDVQVDDVGVVAVQLPQLVALEARRVHQVVVTHVLVRNHVLRLAELVARGLDIVDLVVSVLLGLVDLEEERGLRDDFGVGLLGERLLVQLVFKVLKDEFFLDDVIDFGFDLFDCRDVACSAQGLEGAPLLVEPL